MNDSAYWDSRYKYLMENQPPAASSFYNQSFVDRINEAQKNIDNLVLGNADWTASATKDELEAARKGELHLRFWNDEVPREWLKGIKGKRVLCLAGAGGLQELPANASGVLLSPFVRWNR